MTFYANQRSKLIIFSTTIFLVSALKKCTYDIVSFSGIFRLEFSLAQKQFMLHRCNVREWEWEGMGKALWEIHGNGNWLQNWVWEREEMGIDCTGMGGSGNVKSHSRASLLRSKISKKACLGHLWFYDIGKNGILQAVDDEYCIPYKPVSEELGPIWRRMFSPWCRVSDVSVSDAAVSQTFALNNQRQRYDTIRYIIYRVGQKNCAKFFLQ